MALFLLHDQRSIGVHVWWESSTSVGSCKLAVLRALIEFSFLQTCTREESGPILPQISELGPPIGHHPNNHKPHGDWSVC